jgi:hypothetical protein
VLTSYSTLPIFVIDLARIRAGDSATDTLRQSVGCVAAGQESRGDFRNADTDVQFGFFSATQAATLGLQFAFATTTWEAVHKRFKNSRWVYKPERIHFKLGERLSDVSGSHRLLAAVW